MTTRTIRAEHARRRAAEAEQLARVEWAQAVGQVHEDDRQRVALLERSAELAGEDLIIGLRAHLVSAGARQLLALAEDKAEHMAEVDISRQRLDAAVVRLRSLERLVERLEAADELRRRQQAEAEWRDLVAARAARGAR